MACIDHGAGSGQVYAHCRHNGVFAKRHRVVYIKHHGLQLADIAGKTVRHTCDNVRCINPDHLLIGSHDDNMHDKRVRQREPHRKLTQEQAEQCRKAHVPYHPEFCTSALARQYGVSKTVMHKLITGRTY